MRFSFIMGLQFVITAIYLGLLVVVLRKDPKNLLNRTFALFVGCICWWGVFETFFLWNTEMPKEAVVLGDKIGSLGWIAFSSFFLWFALIFTKKKAILEKKIFYVLLFLVPLILIIREWLSPISVCITDTAYGWIFSWDGSIWTYAFVSFYLGVYLVVLCLLYRDARKTASKLHKSQALLIFYSAIITLVAGTITDVVLPLLTGSPVSSVGNIFFLFLAAGTFYAITKYRLFSLTFSLASPDIINNMSEGLLLLDKEGLIIDANNQVVRLLRTSQEKIISHNVFEYFNGKILDEINKMIEDDSVLTDTDTEIRPGDGLPVPVRFSCSRVTGKDGSFLGWVCMIADISRQKKDEADLASKNAELRDKLAELERFQKIVVDRELKMVELKEEIRHLKGGLDSEAANDSLK